MTLIRDTFLTKGASGCSGSMFLQGLFGIIFAIILVLFMNPILGLIFILVLPLLIATAWMLLNMTKKIDAKVILKNCKKMIIDKQRQLLAHHCNWIWIIGGGGY